MIPEPPNYVDQRLNNYFGRIVLFLNEKGFDGGWTVRALVRHQTSDSWPISYRATGSTMIEALVNIREVLIAAMEADDLNHPRWSMPLLDD